LRVKTTAGGTKEWVVVVTPSVPSWKLGVVLILTFQKLGTDDSVRVQIEPRHERGFLMAFRTCEQHHSTA
jgi:hypothetical protein